MLLINGCINFTDIGLQVDLKLKEAKIE